MAKDPCHHGGGLAYPRLRRPAAHAVVESCKQWQWTSQAPQNRIGKRDSVHHHLLEVIFETATVLELRQKLPHTTPSGWWWWWWW